MKLQDHISALEPRCRRSNGRRLCESDLIKFCLQRLLRRTRPLAGHSGWLARFFGWMAFESRLGESRDHEEFARPVSDRGDRKGATLISTRRAS